MKKTKTQMQSQGGFTLVELAIVMTIVGLLIGGVLKGQELVVQARVTSTIAQIRAYEAAVTTFQDRYSAMPGDMAAASVRIPNCPAPGCDPAVIAASVIGDGLVGTPGWGTAAFPNQANGTVGNETQLFWLHLLQSDLIAGVTTSQLTAAPVPTFSETHPAARVGGGFVAGFGDGTPTPGNAGIGPTGLLLALVQTPNTVMDNLGAATGDVKPMTPSRAAQIDRKIDDGRPASGYVHAYGLPASCSLVVGGAPPIYLESQTTNDCGLVFRIQG